MKSLFSKVKSFLTVGKFSVIMMILGVIGISFMYYVLTYTRILTVPVFLTCVLGIFALAVSEIYCLVILVKYIRKKRQLRKVNGPLYKKSEKTVKVSNKDVKSNIG